MRELNDRGEALRTRLRDNGVDANGSGSLIRLIDDNPRALWWKLYEAGVLTGTNGLLALSTAMTDEHLDAIGDAVITVRNQMSD